MTTVLPGRQAGRIRPAAGLVLAAGMSTRFGADKLAALLDGRPLLQHVLDAAADAGLNPRVVVVAAGRTELEWRGARPVVNPAPQRGMSSSLQVGLEALADEADVERVLVLLGDQPRVAGETIGLLLAQPRDPGRPIVVPRYSGGAPGNPVLLERVAWPLAAELTGDRGMSHFFGARARLVRYVDVGGSNPDIDTPDDLAGLG